MIEHSEIRPAESTPDPTTNANASASDASASEPTGPRDAARGLVPEPVEGAEPQGELDTEDVRQRVIEVLHTIYDPEIPVDIYELGLIYRVDVALNGDTRIEMTLTSPACPVAGTLPPEVEAKVNAVDGVNTAKVEVVWEPPWTPAMMTEAARLELGFF